jgi:E3 ubiquitin-protein ligase RNF14
VRQLLTIYAIRVSFGSQNTRYDALTARAHLSADKDFRWCIAQGCGSGQIHTTGTDGPIFRCVNPKCGFQFCVICGVEYHKDETCRQYQDRISGRKEREEEAATEATKQKTTRKCPGCLSSIEKNEGCDHMTCEFVLPNFTVLLTVCRHKVQT